MRPTPALVVLAGVAVVGAVLYVARAVLVPIALAVLLAFLLSPLVRGAERFLPRGLAVVLVVLLAFSALGGAVWMLSTQVAALGAELPKYRENIRRRVVDLRGAGRGGALENLQSTARDVMRELDTDPSRRRSAERVVSTPARDSFLSLPPAVAPILDAAVQAGLVVALVGFLLLRRHDLRNRLIRLVGESRLTVATKALDDATERVSRYLLALSTVNAAFGVAVGLGLTLIGVPYAALWAVTAAVLRFIPYVGVWTAAALPVVLALAVFPGWREPLLTIGLFAVLEPLIAFVAEPLVYGHRIGVSDVAILIAVAFWTWLWGPIGLVLAVPLTVCVVVLGKHVAGLRFVDILFGETPAVDPALVCYQRLLVGDVDEATAVVEPHAEGTPAAAYDAVLLPALGYARRERVAGRISEDERARVLGGAREIVEAIASSPHAAPEADTRRVVACPVRDDTDALGFVMLRELLDAAHWTIELASGEMLSSELVALVAEKTPAVICVGSVGPGAVAHTRYLVKRLRAAFPEAPIVVGCWAAPAMTPAELDALRAAGAAGVGGTLAETHEDLRRVATIARETRAAA